ncbi:MAG: membrane protein insertion efficiency factor YidD [Actinobacteria bacterium]|nr:membrane protein insertion efficiency factor YidD [Actinomycetota bacterium]
MAHDATRRRVSPVAWLLILPIRFYQKFITPYTPATCRYYPTCSAYAVGALRTHGAIKGLLLTVWRLLRCNPWSSGGVDKVPERGRWRYVPPAADENAVHADGAHSADGAGGLRIADDGVVDGVLVPGPDRDAPGRWDDGDSGAVANSVIPEKTSGGTHVADDTARRCGSCAPSAGRTAA